MKLIWLVAIDIRIIAKSNSQLCKGEEIFSISIHRYRSTKPAKSNLLEKRQLKRVIQTKERWRHFL